MGLLEELTERLNRRRKEMDEIEEREDVLWQEINELTTAIDALEKEDELEFDGNGRAIAALSPAPESDAPAPTEPLGCFEPGSGDGVAIPEGFTKWEGGNCYAPDDTFVPRDANASTYRVEVRYRDGVSEKGDAWTFQWNWKDCESLNDHIIAYRIIEPSAEAGEREWRSDGEAIRDAHTLSPGATFKTDEEIRASVRPLVPDGFARHDGGEWKGDPRTPVEVIFESGKRSGVSYTVEDEARFWHWPWDGKSDRIIAYLELAPPPSAEPQSTEEGELPEGFKAWPGELVGFATPPLRSDDMVRCWMGGDDFIGPLEVREIDWAHKTDRVRGYCEVTKLAEGPSASELGLSPFDSADAGHDPEPATAGPGAEQVSRDTSSTDDTDRDEAAAYAPVNNPEPEALVTHLAKEANREADEIIRVREAEAKKGERKFWPFNAKRAEEVC